MMQTLERFPQIGGIRDYMALPHGERAVYEAYTLDAIERDAKTPVLKVSR